MPSYRSVGAFGAATIVAIVGVTSTGVGTGVIQADAFLTGSGADTSLGDGTALILGANGLPTPSSTYAETASALYLKPNGFIGDTEIVTTPESLGVGSELKAADIVASAIEDQIADGSIDADSPVSVFGYSQSAAFSTFTMEKLADAGVSPNDVHFTLVGDTAAPNGGMLSALDIPSGANHIIPGVAPLGHPTPDDLYPADVYSIEYDGWADFPQYPMNLLADLNAVAGMIFTHLQYLGLDGQQLDDAIDLDTSDDSLVDYHMVANDTLPLLLPLHVLLPGGMGQVADDLLDPILRPIINTGYGNLDHGWNDGPANDEYSLSMGLADIDPDELTARVLEGTADGLQSAWTDLQDPATYQVVAPADDPQLELLVDAANNAGFIDNPDPSSLGEFLADAIASPYLNPIADLF